MDLRKWASDASASPPTPPALPSDGYPTNGNPNTATPATQAGDWWFYALSEELREVILAGGLTPNLSNLTQLRDAIRNIAKGGDYKDSVRVASTAAINLAAPGATIDGVAMVAGDRFLEKDNATLANRGIYIWNGAAVAATRASDADTGAELNSGAIIPIEIGTVNADSNWQLTTDGTVVIGTTGLTFVNITPKQATSLAANGYRVLPAFPGDPTPLIMQWGTATTNASGAVTVTFPITFPNSVFTASTSDGESTATAVCYGGVTYTNSSITLTFARAGVGANAAVVFWFAIGY